MTSGEDFLNEFRSSQKADNFLKELRTEKPFDPSSGLNPAQAFLISTGGGAVKAARGMKNLFAIMTGNKEMREDVRQAAKEQREIMAPLEERFPVSTTLGGITGETAATLPLGLGVGRLAARGGSMISPTVARFTGAGAGGLAEGAVIGAAEDQAGTGAVIGGGAGVALEALMPRLGSLVRRIRGRVLRQSDVASTEAIERLRNELRDAGVRPEEIASALDDISTIGQIPAPGTAEQTARRAAFDIEGVPVAARSRVTQSSDDFAREIQLARQRDNESANTLRQRFFEEDEAIESRARQVANDLGVPEEDGVAIQNAIDDLRSDFGTRKREAYAVMTDLINENPELVELVPLDANRTVRTINNAQNNILRNDQATQDALDSVLAQYGLIGDNIIEGPRFTTVQFLDDERNVIDSIRFRGEPLDFNIANAERFRQDLQFLDPSVPNQAAARRQILGEYDSMLDEYAENLPSDAMPDDIVTAAREARAIAREEKIVFNPKRIVDRLSKANADGNPLMDASRVYENIRKASPEDFQRLMQGLGRVESGEGAINNLRASALVDFANQATRTARKIAESSGASRNMWSGTNFTKAINRFGREKARQLFGDHWPTIQRLERIGESRIAPDTAVQKGSAPDILNGLINSFSRLAERVPVLGTRVADIAQDQQARATLRQVTDLSPTREQFDDYIVSASRRLPLILGITSATTQQLTERDQ